MPPRSSAHTNPQLAVYGEDDDSSCEGTTTTRTVYHQNKSQGQIYNGDIDDGVNTFHDSGKASISGSHNHSTFEKVITTGNSVNMSTFHVHLSAPADLTAVSTTQPKGKNHILQHVIQPILSFFQSVGHREALVHPLPGKANFVANEDSQIPVQYNIENDTARKRPHVGVGIAEHDDSDNVPNDGPEHIQPDYTVASMDELELQPMRSQVTTNVEIYTRRMLCCNEGLPCWRPRPSDAMIKQKGIAPGDVGTFNLTHGFRKLFNLWEDEWVQGLGKLPSREAAIHVSDYFPEGHTIQSGASSKISQSEDGSYVAQYEFQCNARDGAVLACTMSADLEELNSTQAVALERFLIQRAGVIYQRASDAIPLGENDSLYVVTGCIKGNGWGLAAYQDSVPGEVLTLSKRFAQDNTSDKGKIYVWVDRGTAEARLWPNTVKEAALCEGNLKSQSLFLRGFKLAFSPTFRARVKGMKDKPVDGDSSPENDGEEKGGSDGRKRDSFGGGGQPGNGKSTSNFSSSSSSISDPRNHSLTSDVQVDAFPRMLNTSDIHPCDAITTSLLNMTGADCALSHDNDWRLARKGVPSWNLNDAFDIIASKSISVLNGVAHLRPRDELSQRRTSVLLNAQERTIEGKPNGAKRRRHRKTPAQKEKTPQKARTKADTIRSGKPPKNMSINISHAEKILWGGDLSGTRLIGRGIDPHTTSNDFGASIIDINEGSLSYPISLEHALSSECFGREDLNRPLPRLVSNCYVAPDLPFTPFNLDVDSRVHDQSGHSHWPSPTLEYKHPETFHLPPGFDISPSPGPSRQVSVTSIKSVIDSDCSINIDKMNINDNGQSTARPGRLSPPFL